MIGQYRWDGYEHAVRHGDTLPVPYLRRLPSGTFSSRLIFRSSMPQV
ncbi:hypothetical protein PCH70_14940 [Pseudomonas cichorii JBC1]|nr:hypothetical protein PCH70_14940 [Pseudomonas cichorii JBC1]